MCHSGSLEFLKFFWEFFIHQQTMPRLHSLSANTLLLYLRRGLDIKIGQLCYPVPTSVAFCQMVTIHTSFLPGNDINARGYFCSKEIMAQHMESSLSRSRSLIFAQASHLLQATGFRQLWILVIHGWLYQAATAWSSWSQEHTNLLFPIAQCMEFTPFVMLNWLC